MTSVYGIDISGVGHRQVLAEGAGGDRGDGRARSKQQIEGGQDHRHPDDGQVASATAQLTEKQLELFRGHELRGRRDRRRGRLAADERRLGRHDGRERPCSTRRTGARRAGTCARDPRVSDPRLGQRQPVPVRRGRGRRPSSRTRRRPTHMHAMSRKYTGKDLHTPGRPVIVRVTPRAGATTTTTTS